MDDARLPKAVLYGEVCQGKRDWGAPCKRYKDQLKRQLLQVDIDPQNWETLDADRSSQRTILKKAAGELEERRMITTQENRKHRKGLAVQLSNSSDPIFPCPICSKACKSKIGLYSHLRACCPRQNPSHWSSDINNLPWLILRLTAYTQNVYLSHNFWNLTLRHQNHTPNL